MSLWQPAIASSAHWLIDCKLLVRAQPCFSASARQLSAAGHALRWRSSWCPPAAWCRAPPSLTQGTQSSLCGKAAGMCGYAAGATECWVGAHCSPLAAYCHGQGSISPQAPRWSKSADLDNSRSVDASRCCNPQCVSRGADCVCVLHAAFRDKLPPELRAEYDQLHGGEVRMHALRVLAAARRPFRLLEATSLTYALTCSPLSL